MFLIKPRDIPFIDILSCRLSFNGFSIFRLSNFYSRNDVSQIFRPHMTSIMA